jgi:hypothetical protein
MNGKSDRFSLPVLILKKLAHGFFLVAPTTTQPREETWYLRVRLHSVSFCDRGSSPGGMRRRRRLRRAERGRARPPRSRTRKKRAGKELAIFVLVEAGAFDIEHFDAGKVGKSECVDGKLGDRFVCPCIGLVVEDVHGADHIDAEARCKAYREERSSMLNPRNAHPTPTPKTSSARGGQNKRIGTTNKSLALNPPSRLYMIRSMTQPIIHAAEKRSQSRNLPRRQLIGIGSKAGGLNKRRELYPRIARYPRLIEHAVAEDKTSPLCPNPTFEKESDATKAPLRRMWADVWREVGGKLNSGAARASFLRWNLCSSLSGTTFSCGLSRSLSDSGTRH